MMKQDLIFRQDYFADPAAFHALVDLLRDIFGIDIGLLRQFGGPDPTSMPFGYFDASGQLIGNFTAFSMPLIVNGRIVNAAGYQSGAVRPDYRGRGLYRELMLKAFEWAEQSGFEAGILLTDKPDLYRRYGFVAVQQHRFKGDIPRTKGVVASRAINLSNKDDVIVLQWLLANRKPVSNRFSVLRQTELFLLNCCFDPSVTISLIENMQAVIAWKAQDNGRLQILDIVATAIPDMATLVQAIMPQCRQIETCFPPDALDWKAEPFPYKGHCVLMVSGSLQGTLSGDISLSPMAEF
ncbi:GNAT family N-acetyltransferase [Allorhizobium sp. BGMRC 0089]|uniref:GNAT family N-acetyltransferase n=1 Tax=Allorhizobium sonneratiae TaxID=2934936 RepID=UPI0020347F8F|nr:GNAT family N-acetyltransferase [Allorhizobium sonneratiae]MCM2291609.1 GNAT family N-acetyltransferase [Allorhizobium sonneratiae]